MRESLIQRVLVVDDELGYRTAVRQLLRKLGYEAECSNCTADAYEKLAREKFDLVISDIRMDSEDGLQLMRKARQSHPGVDFIIMTGYSAEYSYKNIVDAGAADFILKPFNAGELDAKLNRLEKEKQTLLLLSEAKKKLEYINIELRQTLMGTVRSLASAIGLKDPYTAGHQDRVAGISRAVAEKLGLSPEEREAVHVAGLLHDIGKISVPSEILSKPTRLKDTEMDLVRDHSQSGFEIIRDVKFPWPIGQIILQHHERLDGSGYPAGLTGEHILATAKIIAVADVVEAMMSHRPYRAALGRDKAFEEILSKRGILYDAEIVDACIKLFAQDGYVLDK